MSKILLLYLVFFCQLMCLQAQTEARKDSSRQERLTKAQRKEYKKRGEELKKEFEEYYKNPEKFVEFKEENRSTQRRVDSLFNEVSKQRQATNNDTEQVELLKSAQAEEEAKILELQRKVAESRKRRIPTQGIFYAVQIGENNPESLLKLLAVSEADLSVETDAAGRDTYILGMYPTMAQAQELRRNIYVMGIRRSQVIVIKNGKIVGQK